MDERENWYVWYMGHCHFSTLILEICMMFRRLSHHRRVLKQRHVVPTERCHEKQCSDVIKALNPFSPLRPLTSHVKHSGSNRGDIN